MPGGTADAGPPSTVGTVTRVIDGDTVDVETAVEGTVRVRVIGIDTPETNRPNTPVQCWGPEATDFARAMLDGQRVRMVPDAGQDDVDDYGRALRYLRIGPAEEDYSVAAAEAGAARAYVYDRSNPPSAAADIAAAEDRARAGDVGLWGPPCIGGA
ncbi:thermonuclease family protein [Rhodococcus sp. BP-149]|nr:thermonuclease family protein [Rhodococcus sp. BP-288]MBY6696428.1 thermonuclease family protein [Rhodococcus sp. BP-188]MBY6700560.1 thermonuclease family protein [Rhodococcus sp. BP-285]MBY6704417.1 thermonuclease family protein [Rhodococcus sp. BP-283]MBY6713685.1 thermonuclease family protein [Rhodococcus sp. BP-160]MBY6717063.1 thermonuclease family protein [Rhodococcus sp. BP-110]MBY6722284.1 thermonuclease family protein [Rhodococcus sp. BP-142]MBY6726289.1 thermonuclease family pr